MSQESRLARLAPLIIFLAFLALYISTAARGYIVGGGAEAESMELQRAVVYNGIAHATSYPAYVIFAHYFTRLGAVLGDDPFTWVTYFSSLTVALALVVAYFLLRLYVRWYAAVLAVSLFGLSGVLWHIATIAEVQGLHLLTVMGILYLGALYTRQPERVAYLEGAALLFGLGLANHRIIVLWAPSIALIALGSGALRRLQLWHYVRLAAMLGLPLLLYYDVFFKVPAGVVYGLGTTFNPPINAYNALQIVFGYGQEGLLISPLPELGARIALVGGFHLEFFTPIGVMLGIAGLALFIRRAPLYGTALLIGSALSFAFFMTWRQDHKAFIYYGQSGFALIVGLAHLADLSVRLPRVGKRLSLALPLAALIPLLFALSFPKNNRALDTRGAEYFAAYASLPPESIVFTGGWSPDHWIGLEAVAAGYKIGLFYDREAPFIAAVANERRTQNIYLSHWMQMYLGMLSGQNPLLELGMGFGGTHTPFIQVLPRGDPRIAAEAEQATKLEQMAAPGIQLYSYHAHADQRGAYFTLYWRVVGEIPERFIPFAHLRTVDSAGNTTGLIAQRDYPDPVRGYYPTTAWQQGEVIRDTVFIAWTEGELPPAESLRWTFGFVSPSTGQRVGEIFLPFSVAARP